MMKILRRNGGTDFNFNFNFMKKYYIDKEVLEASLYGDIIAEGTLIDN
jgi:hypothetical protein